MIRDHQCTRSHQRKPIRWVCPVPGYPGVGGTRLADVVQLKPGILKMGIHGPAFFLLNVLLGFRLFEVETLRAALEGNIPRFHPPLSHVAFLSHVGDDISSSRVEARLDIGYVSIHQIFTRVARGR